MRHVSFIIVLHILCRPKGENIDVKTLAPVGEGEGSEECGGERESE